MAGLPEELERIVHALAVDESLALWFEDLALAPESVRGAEFRATASRLRIHSPALAQAVSLLAVPGVYATILARFRAGASDPCGGEGDPSSYGYA